MKNRTRLTISEYAEGVEIIISPARSVFLALWLLAWSYGELVALWRLAEA